MHRLLFLAALCGVLVSCGPSKAERRARFIRSCVTAGFTGPQCTFLAQMREDAEDDSSDAAALAGAAMGQAATRGLGR